jgi:DNA-binding CsgD family transcriptional regulator/tetratricopeptide (TPR) repeat protein
VTETVRQRLADLDHDAREVLVCAALLGRTFDWRLLAPASGSSEQDVYEALRQATELQLLDADGGSFRFRRALTRDAVLAAVLPPDVGRLAMATRAAVEAAHPGVPDEWCTVAADLAERAGDRDGAAGLLVTAGRRALRQAALVTAERLLRRAVELSATAEGAAEADEVLAEVLAAAGRVDEAAAIAHAWLAARAYEPGRRVRLQLLIARAAVAGERWGLADEQLEDSRPVAGGIPVLAAQHAALCAQVAVGTGRTEEAVRAAAAALQAAERTGQPEVACEALEVIGRVERLRSLPAARAAFERGAAIAEANGLVFWHLRALHELGTVDMFERGELDRLFQARSLALNAGALIVNAVLDVQLAGGLWLRGEAAECIAAGRRAADAGRRFRVEGIRRAGLCFVAIGHGPLIDPAGLEAGAAAQADETDDPGWTAAVWGDGWSVYALLTEDRQRAVRSIETAAELGCAGAVPLPSPWWGLWPLLRAVQGGDAEDALAATVRGVPDRWNDMMLGYARAVTLGRRGLTAQADAAYAAADEAHVPWQWWRQLGRRLIGEAALQDHWGEPIQWLREAATFFDGFPAPAVASACRSMLRRAGVAPTPARPAAHLPSVLAAHGVTGREAEVLRLVGEGMSNREVGERLFLSPRTVEKHVENLGRKLGVATRSQLVAYGASLHRTT